jgi:hypothetical protein
VVRRVRRPNRMTLARTLSQSALRIRPPGRVLLVGDQAPSTDALRRGLSDDNHVVVAGEAAEALSRLDEGSSTTFCSAS